MSVEQRTSAAPPDPAAADSLTRTVIAALYAAIPTSRASPLGRLRLLHRLLVLPLGLPLWLLITGRETELMDLWFAVLDYAHERAVRAARLRRHPLPSFFASLIGRGASRLLEAGLFMLRAAPGTEGKGVRPFLWSTLNRRLMQRLARRGAWEAVDRLHEDRYWRDLGRDPGLQSTVEADLDWVTTRRRLGYHGAAASALVSTCRDWATDTRRQRHPQASPLLALEWALTELHSELTDDPAGLESELARLHPECVDLDGIDGRLTARLDAQLALLRASTHPTDIPVRSELQLLAQVDARFGAADGAVLEIAATLADAARSRGALSDARSLQETLVHRQRRLVGADHPTTLFHRASLARVWDESGEPALARAAALEALAALDRCNHPAQLHFAAAGALLLGTLASLRRQAQVSDDELRGALTRLPTLGAQMMSELELRPRDDALAYRAHVRRFTEQWLSLALEAGAAFCFRPLHVIHNVQSLDVALDERVLHDPGQTLTEPERDFLVARSNLNAARRQERQDALFHARANAGQRERWARSTQARCVLTRPDPTQAYLRTRSALGPRARRGFTAESRLDGGARLPELRTADREAIAVLFSAADGHHALVHHHPQVPQRVPLPDLPAFQEAVGDYLLSHRAAFRGAGLHTSETTRPVPSLPTLHELGHRALWAPLQRALPDIATWHVVTGQTLHRVPFEFGRGVLTRGVLTRGVQAAIFYPGLPAFWRQYGAAAPASDIAPSLALSLDPAWDTVSPLPCVDAEANCVRAILDTVGIPSGVREGDAVLTADNTASWLHVACHGSLEGVDDERHGTLVLSAAAALVLDPVSAQQLPRSTREVFFSACVAGIMSHPETEEVLGLPAALALRGASVIGALGPLPDFYMPVASSLYWHARTAARDGPRSAADALQRMRSQLRSGDWPLEIVDLLRAQYAVTLDRILERIGALWRSDEPRDAELARRLARSVIDGWCLPESLTRVLSRSDDADGRERDLELLGVQCCQTEHQRRRLVDEVLRRLIEERQQPTAEVRAAFDHVGSFQHCWGR